MVLQAGWDNRRRFCSVHRRRGVRVVGYQITADLQQGQIRAILWRVAVIMNDTVELHRRQRAEIGMKRAKYRARYQRAQFGVTWRAEQSTTACCARILADLVVDQLAARAPPLQRMNSKHAFVSEPENFSSRMGLLEMIHSARRAVRDPSKSHWPSWACGSATQETGVPRLVGFLQIGQEHTGKVSDHFRVQAKIYLA